MFKTKQTPVAGACLANRCKAAPVGGGERSDLCAQHYNEWFAGAKPALEPSGDRKPRATAALAESSAIDTVAIRAELEPVRNALERLLQMAATVPFEHVFTPGTFGESHTEPITGLQLLGTMREQARQKFAALEDRRTSLTKPILQIKYSVDGIYKPSLEQCESVMKICTDRLTEYERGRMLAQRAAAAQVQTAPSDPTLLAVAHGGAAALPDEVRSQPKWIIRVDDFAKVPDQFKLFDQRTADLYVNSKRGQCAIPGCTIIEDVKVTTAIVRGVGGCSE